jgi:hypothetical protein
MGFGRQVFEFLKQASIAHAKWDMEMSLSILRSRKKLAILGLMVLPILLINFAFAADMIGSKTAYAPAFYTNTIFVVSIFVGLAAGLITGCIGAGGGFIITPALMARASRASSPSAPTCSTSSPRPSWAPPCTRSSATCPSSWPSPSGGVGLGHGHRRGHQHRPVQQGSPALRDVHQRHLRGAAGLLGFYALFDYLSASRKARPAAGTTPTAGPPAPPAGHHHPEDPRGPMITFDEDFVPGGKQISAGSSRPAAWWSASWRPSWAWAAASSLPHVRVHFRRFQHDHRRHRHPADHLHGGPAAVGQYAIYGYVFYTWHGNAHRLAPGIQVGALTTKVVKGIHIRGFYAISIIAGFINRISVLPRRWSNWR